MPLITISHILGLIVGNVGFTYFTLGTISFSIPIFIVGFFIIVLGNFLLNIFLYKRTINDIFGIKPKDEVIDRHKDKPINPYKDEKNINNEKEKVYI